MERCWGPGQSVRPVSVLNGLPEPKLGGYGGLRLLYFKSFRDLSPLFVPTIGKHQSRMGFHPNNLRLECSTNVLFEIQFVVTQEMGTY